MDEDVRAAMEAAKETKATLARFIENNNGPPVAPYGGRTLPHPIQQNLQAARDGQQIENLPQAPINAEELHARLQAIPLDSDDRDIGATRSTTPIIDDDSGFSRESEHDDYHLLIADGGRPFYPIESLQAVEQDSDAYFELLYPWQHVESWEWILSDWEVFQRQLVRWERFREWQLECRNQQDDLSLERFIEKKRTRFKRFADRSNLYAMLLAGFERPIAKHVYDEWEQNQVLRKHSHLFIGDGDHAFDGFSDYIEAVRRCLSQQGFTGYAEFDIDPRKQDRLATWAEYVHYEFRWLDSYKKALERAAPQLEKAWQKYHAQGQFTKDETVDVLQSKVFQDKVGNEADKAFRETDVAREAFERLRKRIGGDTDGMPEKIRRQVEAAEGRVNAARARYSLANKKWQAVTSVLRTERCDRYRDHLPRQKLLCQWAMDQLLLIEAESGPSTKTNPVGAGKRGTGSDNLNQESKSGNTAFQDVSAVHKRTGVSTMIKGLDVSPSTYSPSGDGITERQGKSPPIAENSMKAGKCNSESDSTDYSTGRRYKTRMVASQEALVAPEGTGITTITKKLDVSPTTGSLEQTNSPGWQEKSPPPVTDSAKVGKRKAGSDDPSNSVGRRSKTKRVTTQDPATIQSSIKTFDALTTTPGKNMASVTRGPTARSLRATKASKTKDQSRLATERRRTDQEKNGHILRGKEFAQVSHRDGTSRGAEVQEAKPAAAKTSRKRKRVQTDDEIEASIERLKSLRKRPRERTIV